MAKYKKAQKPNNKPEPVKTSVQTKMKNATQLRASFALSQIASKVISLETKEQKEFKSYVQALPAMVQMNGLGQSIAFCRSKYTAQDTSKNGAKAYKTLYVIIQEWLCNGDFAIFNKGDDLLEAIVSNDMHKYRLAQSELQDLLSWLKKATLALVEISEEDDNDAVRS